MPRVSVIIPTFNRIKFLERAIRSVQAQSFKDWELIIVDDASTDGTADFLKERQEQEGDKIKSILLAKNGGVSRARNKGRESACGEWIALLDSDDEWLPHRLEAQLEWAARHPQYPLIHGEELWVRKGKRVNQKKIHQKSGGRILKRALHLCLISPSATLIKGELYDQMGGFREDYPVCEDYEMWLKVCARYEVGFIERPLIIKYGGHSDQLSARYKAMDFWRVKALDELFKGHREFLKKDEKEELVRVLLRKAMILKQGYLKHHNLENLPFIESLLHEYQDQRALQDSQSR